MTQNLSASFKLIHLLLWIKVPHQSHNFRLSNMLWWKFAKFLMSFLEAQVSFPSSVASIFIATKHILFLAQTLYTLFKRSLLKCTFLRFANAQVKIRQILHVNLELTSQCAKFLMSFKAQVIFPSTFASKFSSIKNDFSILFLAQTLFTFVTSSLLKWKFLRCLSAWVKICQIAHVNFELTSQSLFNFCIILHSDDR